MAIDKDLPYRVAYDEAVRALSQQQGMIDSLRTRAGLLRYSVLQGPPETKRPSPMQPAEARDGLSVKAA